MSIYQITDDPLVKIQPTTFSREGIRERSDLQRLHGSQIKVISPDRLIVAEEFGGWEESKRRIDLPGLDKDANLVVTGHKRTKEGDHMELQAIRSAQSKVCP